MSVSSHHPHRPLRPSRLINAGTAGSLVLTGVFAVTFWLALGFERESAVFPLGASGLGMALGLLGAAQSWRADRSSAPAAAPATLADDDGAAAAATAAPTADPSGPAEDVEIGDPLDYVFATASARLWGLTLAAFGGFFLLLYLVGLYVTAPVFCVVYLRTQDDRSWRFSLTYAVVLTALLYLIFEVTLGQPMPTGLLGVG